MNRLFWEAHCLNQWKIKNEYIGTRIWFDWVLLEQEHVLSKEHKEVQQAIDLLILFWHGVYLL